MHNIGVLFDACDVILLFHGLVYWFLVACPLLVICITAFLLGMSMVLHDTMFVLLIVSCEYYSIRRVLLVDCMV